MQGSTTLSQPVNMTTNPKALVENCDTLQAAIKCNISRKRSEAKAVLSYPTTVDKHMTTSRATLVRFKDLDT